MAKYHTELARHTRSQAKQMHTNVTTHADGTATYGPRVTK